jgi:hypothetical protein
VPSRDASLRNLEKARERGRPPRPWRCTKEMGVIRRLVWQWFLYTGADKWSGRAVSRRLGVSHTYVQKLVREFTRDRTRILRQYRAYGLATFDELSRAQEQTQRQRERGEIRSPRFWKTVEYKIGNQVVHDVVRTKAGEKHYAALRQASRSRPTT